MKLAETIRLLYAQGDAYRYCSTQFELPEEITERVEALTDQIDKKDLTGVHLEDQPHITLKWGIRGSVEAALNVLTRLLKNQRPISVTLGKTSYFAVNPHTDNSDVVIVQVSSPDLYRLYRLLTANLNTTESFAEYRPHITVAYVKPGTGKKYIGNPALLNTKLTLSSVDFSNTDGTKTVLPFGNRVISANWQIRRINNEMGIGGPDLYQVTDENGNPVGEPSRDEAGALIQRDKLMRERSGLGKRPAAVKKAEDLLYGREIVQDNRLRRTTGGTGGGAGPGAGNG